MRKSISQIVAELDQLQMQGVSLTYRQKQQIAKNENVIKGKMSVQDAYMENVSRRTQPVFETVPEQNIDVTNSENALIIKMNDYGDLQINILFYLKIHQGQIKGIFSVNLFFGGLLRLNIRLDYILRNMMNL